MYNFEPAANPDILLVQTEGLLNINSQGNEYIFCFGPDVIKLDGVGPVDNRPSTDKLHNFVKKKKYIYI